MNAEKIRGLGGKMEVDSRSITNVQNYIQNYVKNFNHCLFPKSGPNFFTPKN